MLLGLLFIFSFFLLSMMVLDYMVLKTNMEKAKDAVMASCLAASGEIDQEALSYNVLEIDENEAEATFISYLHDNIQRICVDLPVIEEFEVYNQDDLPAVCSCGNSLESPAIHTIVRMTLKRPVLGGLLGDNYPFRIHIDSDVVLE